jgi:cystathionine gamma-synthase
MVYARSDTETWHGVEEIIGQLEAAPQPAVLFASGMAATTAVWDLLPLGGRLIMPVGAYQIAATQARALANSGLLKLTEVDIANTAQVKAELIRGNPQPRATIPPQPSNGIGHQLPAEDLDATAGLLWIESPTNPLLQVAAIAQLCQTAHQHGWLVAVDNTFATPLAQQPLKLGADLVVHSVSKYLAGHSDLVLGAVVAANQTLDQRLRLHRSRFGGIAGPFEAWLALRGIRTLPLRLEKATSNANYLAKRLANDPRVTKVRYPGLVADPGHSQAKAQMSSFGAIIAIELAGGAAAADRLVAAVKLWLPATSLGGVESCLERRRRFPTESLAVPESLIRLSVGVEDPADLWADLDQALAAAS